MLQVGKPCSAQGIHNEVQGFTAFSGFRAEGVFQGVGYRADRV